MLVQVIGAIGVSGDTSDKDEYCAVAAAKQIGVGTHTHTAQQPVLIQLNLACVAVCIPQTVFASNFQLI